MPPRPIRIPLSPFKTHCEKWRNGCGHGACEINGTKIVIARGQVPADIVFCGESPGESENVLGIPFVGQAGRLIDDIIRQAITQDYPQCRVAMTNLVGCLPRVNDGPKAGEPEDDQIRSCSGRLREFLEICKPRLIVCVGKHARQWFQPHMRDSVDIPESIMRVNIVHPAAILRMQSNLKSTKIRECIVTVSNAVETMYEKPANERIAPIDWSEETKERSKYDDSDIPF